MKVPEIIDSVNRLLADVTDPWDDPAITRQVVKHLKCLQQTLQQTNSKNVSDDIGSSFSKLLPFLQSLFTFGIDAPSTRNTDTYNTNNISSMNTRERTTTTTTHYSPMKSNRYIPPPARQQHITSTTAHTTTTTATASYYSDSDLSDAEHSDSSSCPSTTTSSSSFFSNSGSSKVRYSALTCLQLAIKFESKALHPFWPTLLPSSDPIDNASDEDGPYNYFTRLVYNKEKNATMTKIFTDAEMTQFLTTNKASLAYILLKDPSARVRLAAAITLSTLLEGPAQRAYLAVAEWTFPQKKNSVVRGFIPLSLILARSIIGTHIALLTSLLVEEESAVLVATLRALTTVIIGSPYHRLPDGILPQCVYCIWHRTVPLIQGVVAVVPHSSEIKGSTHTRSNTDRMHAAVRDVHKDAGNSTNSTTNSSTNKYAPVLSGCFSCLAAAFGVKPPVQSVEKHLLSHSYIHGEKEAPRKSIDKKSGDRTRDTSSVYDVYNDDGDIVPTILFLAENILSTSTMPPDPYSSTSTAATAPTTSIQLEAIMSLRGLTQQYPSVVLPYQYDMLEMVRQKIASLDTNSTTGTSIIDTRQSMAVPLPSSLEERIIKQCILLLGDFLHIENTSSTSCNTIAKKDGDFIDTLNIQKEMIICISSILAVADKANASLSMMLAQPHWRGESLQAAAFISISRISPSSINNNNNNIDEKSNFLMDTLLIPACFIATTTTTTLSIASPVRSASAKALANVLFLFKNGIHELLCTDNDGSLLQRIIDHAVPAAIVFSEDDVLAVRIPGANVLASLGELMYTILVMDNNNENGAHTSQNGIFTNIVVNAVMDVFPAVLNAAKDHDKVKVDGVHALGYLIRLGIMAFFHVDGHDSKAKTSTTTTFEQGKLLVQDGIAVLVESVLSNNVKIQWSACTAAGLVLKSAHETIAGDKETILLIVSPIRDTLLVIKEQSTNARTKALAEAHYNSCNF